jgi:hypothetical protein
VNNKKNFTLTSDWVQKTLTKLQRELETSGKWPEPANQLWLDLVVEKQADVDKKADDNMFSIVVSDAINGVDINKRYPNFYRQMLRNPEIFQAFLDVIEVVEADKEGLLEPVEAMSTAVPVVMADEAQPVLEWLNLGNWVVKWEQTVIQLNAIFRDLGSELSLKTVRSVRGFLEESVAPLIRSEVVVEDKNFGVRLSAVLDDDPEALNLKLVVAVLDDDSADFPLTSLRAGIHWGEYQAVQSLNELGQAAFPPLPIKSITDETGEAINTDLKLLIHPEA